MLELKGTFVVFGGSLNLSVPDLEINYTWPLWLLQGLNEIIYQLINLALICGILLMYCPLF